MNDKIPEWHEQLRAPFPREVVGKLPKPYKRDSPRSQCRECGGYHGLPAAHLDYVGHAAVTDRLLSVDPEWSWEPMGLTPEGLPALDREGNLWIRLTVNGHTRPGVGDGSSMKERIGDALRNAAMRFGVALDLWSKEELESGGKFDPVAPAHVSPPPAPLAGPQMSEDDARAWMDSVGQVTDLDALRALWKDAGEQGALLAVPGLKDALTARSQALAA